MNNGKPSKFSLFIAKLKHWAWIILTKFGITLVCIFMMSEGLRMLVPALGQRLHRFPGLQFLKDYEETHRLDLAPILALFMTIAVWHLWEKVLRMHLLSDAIDEGWNATFYRRLVTVLGVAILGADAVLFYVASTFSGWGSALSLSAFAATVAYVAVLVFCVFVGIVLHKRVLDLERKA